jgi:hypothetical protein
VRRKVLLKSALVGHGGVSGGCQFALNCKKSGEGEVLGSKSTSIGVRHLIFVCVNCFLTKSVVKTAGEDSQINILGLECEPF